MEDYPAEEPGARRIQVHPGQPVLRRDGRLRWLLPGTEHHDKPHSVDGSKEQVNPLAGFPEAPGEVGNECGK